MIMASGNNPVAAGDRRPSTSHFDQGLRELQAAPKCRHAQYLD